jgi:hypothetical protein
LIVDAANESLVGNRTEVRECLARVVMFGSWEDDVSDGLLEMWLASRFCFPALQCSNRKKRINAT